MQHDEHRRACATVTLLRALCWAAVGSSRGHRWRHRIVDKAGRIITAPNKLDARPVA